MLLDGGRLSRSVGQYFLTGSSRGSYFLRNSGSYSHWLWPSKDLRIVQCWFQVGRRYLDHLIEDAQFDNAGNLCIRLFKNNAKLWQDEIIRFVAFSRFGPITNLEVFDHRVLSKIWLILTEVSNAFELSNLRSWFLYIELLSTASHSWIKLGLRVNCVHLTVGWLT